MATGDERTNFADKRELPQQRIKDTFFDYLEERLLEVASRVWGSQRGVFGAATIIASGNNQFDITTLPIDFLDGDGNILTLESADADDITFANENAIPYYIGVRHCLIPNGVLRNPRNQVIFYDMLEDRIGEVEEPDSVTENAGGLKIYVDSIFEATQRSDDRLVTVWLRQPVSIDESVAIERNLLVVWDGSNNYIQTVALLGQGAGSASTNVADYQVCAQGVTVRKNTNLSTTSPYAFIGTVDGATWGNPPSAFSVIGQIDVSDGINPDLQEAYTSGRTITPTSAYGGAVRIESPDSGDSMESLLVLDRKGSTEDTPIALSIINERDVGIPFIALNPMIETGGALQEDESGDTTAGAGIIDLTRGAVDLTASAINPLTDLVVLSGFATAGVNRIYKISTYAAAQVTLVDLDGTTPTPWTGSESGNVSFMRPQVVMGDENSAGGMSGLARPLTLMGSNNPLSPAVLRIYPMNATSTLEVMSDDGATTVMSIAKSGAIDCKEITVNPGNNATATTDDGGIIIDPTNLDLGSEDSGLVTVLDPASSILSLRMERYGRIAKPHVFEDDFHYSKDRWSPVSGTITIANFPKEYTYTASHSGSSEAIGIVPPSTSLLGWGGAVIMIAPIQIGGFVHLFGPQTFCINTDIMLLRFMARYAIDGAIDRRDFVGVSDPADWNNARIGFTLNQLAGANSWDFEAADGSNLKTVSLGLANESLNTYRNLYFSVIDKNTVEVFAQGMSNPVEIDISPVDLSIISKTLPTCPTNIIEIGAAASTIGYLDYWHISSAEAISSSKPDTPA